MGSIVGGVIEEFDSHMGLLVLQTGWKGYGWEMQIGVRVGCVAATGVAMGGYDNVAVGIYVYIRVGVACRRLNDDVAIFVMNWIADSVIVVFGDDVG
ncbi:hypothetical protein F0562_017761 [Nyssa sinensis]|uniref:Uncharacterized protein n=1 Tax=Nyssa sinensis TaxID=561372 RepID=A0A5J4ZIY2_9ASTE|nr:hypothetical protein F0562_017761 [Nyssa sinensis]